MPWYIHASGTTLRTAIVTRRLDHDSLSLSLSLSLRHLQFLHLLAIESKLIGESIISGSSLRLLCRQEPSVSYRGDTANVTLHPSPPPSTSDWVKLPCIFTLVYARPG